MYQRLAARASAYPLADLALPIKQAIVDAVEAAWREVLSVSSQFANENDATTMLVEALRSVRSQGSIPLFSEYYFQTPVRDACETNFSGAAPSKRPDIHLRLINAVDDYEGWFIECKVVDRRHPVQLYLQQGINRYVTGEYAWAMPSALMIAYASDGFTIATNLAAALPASSQPQPSGLRTTADAGRTIHCRNFMYLGPGGAPGNIELVHLWLSGGTVV